MALFVKLDTTFWEHPKVLAAGERAAVLYLQMLCYSQDALSDGWVPDGMLPRFGLGQLQARTAALAAAALIERGEGGWRIAGWAERNRTRAEVEQLRAVRREAGSKGGRPRKQTETNLVSNQEANHNPDLRSQISENPAPPAPPPDDGPSPPDAELVALADQTIQAAIQDPGGLANEAQRLAVAEVLAAGHPPSAVLAAGLEASGGRHPTALLRAILARMAANPPVTAPAEPRPLLHDQRQPCANSECVDGWVGGIGPDGRPETPERCPDCTGVRA